MANTDSSDEMARLEEFEERDSSARHTKSSDSFLWLLSSSLIIVVLLIILSLQLAFSTEILIAFALCALILCGFIYRDRNRGATMLSEIDENELTETTVSQREYEKQEEGGQSELDQQELSPFEELVRSALDSIPYDFQEHMQNVVVQVEDEPDKETLERVGTREGMTLLGLYHGVPITAWGYQRALLPQHITIYQNTIERYCEHDPERIREQVRATVLHEVAHHFGISHEEMPIWIR